MKRDKLEKILRRQKTPEPSPYLEKRIMDYVESKGRKRRYVPFLVSALSFAAAIALIIGLHIYTGREKEIVREKRKEEIIVERESVPVVEEKEKLEVVEEKKEEVLVVEPIEGIHIVYPEEGGVVNGRFPIVVAGAIQGSLQITLDDTTWVVPYKPVDGFVEITDDFLKTLSEGEHYLMIKIKGYVDEVIFSRIVEVALK
jgi:hypothetical protein